MLSVLHLRGLGHAWISYLKGLGGAKSVLHLRGLGATFLSCIWRGLVKLVCLQFKGVKRCLSASVLLEIIINNN